MHSTEKKKCVALVPLFTTLDENKLTELSQKVTSRKVSKGEFLYGFTDPNDTLYIVHRGQLKNYRLLENGEEQLIRLLGPGEFTGEWSIFQAKQPHNDLVEAINDTEICQLTQRDFNQALLQYPEIGMNLLQQMAKRLEASEQQVATIAHTSITDRVFSYLTGLIPEENVENKSISVELPMSRKSLASYLGTTPESISRGFKRLEKEGMITSVSSKKICINELGSL
ncbi:MAG: Crp/Fnr family transcriptional regulator [Liquorilactobacillus sp.]|jgi:CRP/FNR family transcriptional regulator|uniref:Crp/Fnr family transcriptional regulator n=1 Tax=Liquorilactobacillus nagelii TaxID=82688 RepID=UPI0039E80A0E